MVTSVLVSVFNHNIIKGGKDPLRPPSLTPASPHHAHNHVLQCHVSTVL